MSEINNTPEIEFPAIEVMRVVQAPIDDTLSIEGMAADAKATGDAIAAAKEELEESISTVSEDLAAVRDVLFPVGSVYISTSATAPEFGGSWVEILMPTTWGDLLTGARSYTEREEETAGTLNFWLRVEEVTS